jgi:hypothetical protein
MKLYRIQHKQHQTGMWRGLVNGKPIVEHLTDKKLANMPMPDHPRYSKDGKNWKSAVNSKEAMFYWFTTKEIAEFVALGMGVFSFDCEECYMVEHQEIVFNEADMKNIQDVTEEFLNR